MHDFPHHYHTTCRAEQVGPVQVESPSLPTLQSAPPAEFGGPGDQWSPETFLTAAVADCFVLGFRAVARASSVEWNSIVCKVVGVLERVERTTKFTKMELDVDLVVPAGVNRERVERVLAKAEHTCLITNSLSAQVTLTSRVSEA